MNLQKAKTSYISERREYDLANSVLSCCITFFSYVESRVNKEKLIIKPEVLTKPAIFGGPTYFHWLQNISLYSYFGNLCIILLLEPPPNIRTK
jgi:hypothetical protein